MKNERLANTAAEREILGSILAAPADLHKVSGIIKASDFYRIEYRLIFETMTGMILQDQPVDVVTLTEEIRAAGEGDFLTLARAVLDLGIVGRVYGLEAKAEIVADYSRRRQLIEKSRQIAAMAADMGQDVDAVAATFSNDLQGMNSKAHKTISNMSAAIVEFMGTLERRRNGETLATGLADVDTLITGFEPGQLITIAGRPGHGKSALAGTIAVNLAKQGKEILLYSMEMGAGELAGRFLSRFGGVDGTILKRGNDSRAEKIPAGRGAEAGGPAYYHLHTREPHTWGCGQYFRQGEAHGGAGFDNHRLPATNVERQEVGCRKPSAGNILHNPDIERAGEFA